MFKGSTLKKKKKDKAGTQRVEQKKKQGGFLFYQNKQFETNEQLV